MDRPMSPKRTPERRKNSEGDPDHNSAHEEADDTNLVRENGHLLIRSLDVEDWQQALEADREARLLSLGGTFES